MLRSRVLYLWVSWEERWRKLRYFTPRHSCANCPAPWGGSADSGINRGLTVSPHAQDQLMSGFQINPPSPR